MGGPRNGYVSTGAELDCAQDVANRKVLHRRYLHVRAGPNRALSAMQYFCRCGAQEKSGKSEAMGRHHDQIGPFLMGGLHDGRGYIALQQLTLNGKATKCVRQNFVLFLLGLSKDRCQQVPADHSVPVIAVSRAFPSPWASPMPRSTTMESKMGRLPHRPKR